MLHSVFNLIPFFIFMKIISSNIWFWNDSRHILVLQLKFKFSEKATKIEKIFTVNLKVCSNRQIDCEDFVNFCGLLRKHELYFILAVFDVEVESYILNLQTIGKKQLIVSFIFSLISRNLLHLAGSAKLYHILFYDGRNLY